LDFVALQWWRLVQIAHSLHRIYGVLQKRKYLVIREKSGGISGGIWQGTVNMLDQLNLRFKYVLAFMIGAVIAAAALRHGVHVYGGFSREEIRTDALMAIPFVALAAVFVRRKRRQR
jgi:hypothetical protein